MPLDQPQPARRGDLGAAKSLEQNLSVIAARLDVDVAKRNVKIAQSGHMPSVDLFANRTEFDNRRDADQQRLSKARRIPTATDDTYGVRVNIPIFSGGDTHVASPRAGVPASRRARAPRGRDARAERDTRDAYLGVIAEKGARDRRCKQSVKSNQTALEATEAGFEVGTRTTVDVLDARRRLFEAQRDYARSRYDYLINLVQTEVGGRRPACRAISSRSTPS